MAFLVLPFCYFPIFGFYAIYGFVRGRQLRNTKVTLLSLALAAASGGPYTVCLPLYAVIRIFVAFTKLIGLHDEWVGFLDRLFTSLVTPTAP